jgi:dynein heavy chain
VQEAVSEADAELKKSLEAVNRLNTTHLVELKNILKSPPKTVVVVLAGACILLQDEIVKMNGEIIMRRVEGSLKKEENWTETARIYLLNDPKALLSTLQGYKKEEINQALIAKYRKKVRDDPDYNYDKAKGASLPIEVLYLWCEAMYAFNEIYLRTQPLRDKLAAVRELVAEKTKLLNEKKADLAEIMAKLQKLED